MSPEFDAERILADVYAEIDRFSPVLTSDPSDPCWYCVSATEDSPRMFERVHDRCRRRYVWYLANQDGDEVQS